MGVMASLAVFCVISKAPVIMVVSSCVGSPPFPAYNNRIQEQITMESLSAPGNLIITTIINEIRGRVELASFPCMSTKVFSSARLKRGGMLLSKDPVQQPSKQKNNSDPIDRKFIHQEQGISIWISNLSIDLSAYDDVITGQAAVPRCKASVNFFEDAKLFFPPTINYKDLHPTFQAIAGVMLGIDNVENMQPLMGSEDFALYQELIPGYFFFLGMQNETKKPVEYLHSPYAQVNEDVLPYSAALHASLAARYLLESQPVVPFPGSPTNIIGLIL